MPRQIRLNAFDMNCVGHIQHGMWAHPRDRSMDYTDLEHWVALARTLERGLFDGSVPGRHPRRLRRVPRFARCVDPQRRADPGERSAAADPGDGVRHAHLGFGVTCNLTYEPPYTFARRMSTLDHLTKGRIGWNIVTGYLDSAARGMGLAEQPEHDSRYDVAEEYMQVVYQLWEGSWEDGAVLRDREGRVFADPARIHPVQHNGRNYQVNAIHLSEPSPQRTPVLYQAGCVGTRPGVRRRACRVRVRQRPVQAQRARHRRRHPRRGRRRSAAIRTTSRCSSAPPWSWRRPRPRRATSWRSTAPTPAPEGALAHYSASVGVDFSRYGPDEPIRFVKTNAVSSNLEAITARSRGTEWTPRKLLEMMVLGSRQAPIVGSPSTVADELQAWVDEADVDGFNLSRTVVPECVEDFVALVVPELQSRGVMKREYAAGTLAPEAVRRRPCPAADNHPAARYRR